MQHDRGQLNRGFTIVELLIVIVIIGILAAMIIAAYNGITERASNQQTETAVNEWRKAMIQYATDHGSYPITYNACFSETNLANCWPTAGASTTLNNALRPYMGNKNPLTPLSPQEIITAGWGTRIGGGYYHNPVSTLDGVLHPYIIAYNLKGVGKCNLSGVLSYAGGVWTNFSSTPPVSKYTHMTAGASFCAIALPDPTKL